MTGSPLPQKTLLYRGNLKSCNYHCSYCPFSKHPINARELEKDRGQWLSFVKAFTEKSCPLGIRAFMAVPYGEALIHPWYWEGLAHISACPHIDAAGAQTNLSFPIQESLSHFDRCGGNRKKLRLWATFHPEMTTAETFARRCGALARGGISLCAGAVGVPENIGLLQSLREKLPETIYLWVNKMDGLKRPYSKGELDAFSEIDPYFLQELTPVPAHKDKCRGRIFVEGNGRLRTCNISGALDMDWSALCTSLQIPEPRCGRRICSCYLAYAGRSDFVNQTVFGPYPLLRIPRKEQAGIPAGDSGNEFSDTI